MSSEWFSRAASERYLSLWDLYAAVLGRTERRRTRTAENLAVRVEASRDDAERLAMMLRPSYSGQELRYCRHERLVTALDHVPPIPD